MKNLAEGGAFSFLFGGEKNAQFALGELYLLGDGVIKNEVKATEYFYKAQEQYSKVGAQTSDYGHAQCRLGEIHEKGYGIPKDFPRAINFYQTAIIAGEEQAKEHFIRLANTENNAQAQWVLAKLYFEGKGIINRDEGHAIQYLLKAAQQSHAGALSRLIDLANKGNDASQLQYALGLMYEQGLGVEKNYSKAAGWYKRSGKQDKVDALLRLGILHEDGGYGLNKDEIEAVKWYQKALLGKSKEAKIRLIDLADKKNHPEAQFVLAGLYLSGEGVEREDKVGIEYLLRATKQGHSSALERFIRLTQSDMHLSYELGLLYQME